MFPPHPMFGVRPDDIHAMRTWSEALKSEPEESAIAGI